MKTTVIGESQKNFDNILDTPNAVIFNENNFILHLYSLLMKQYAIDYKNTILDLLKKYKFRED